MNSNIYTLLLGIILFAIGALNTFLVHPVPGIIFILISLLYLPATDRVLKQAIGFSVPIWIKVILALIGIWFTLGISDLGDMMDDVLAK